MPDPTCARYALPDRHREQFAFGGCNVIRKVQSYTVQGVAALHTPRPNRLGPAKHAVHDTNGEISSRQIADKTFGVSRRRPRAGKRHQDANRLRQTAQRRGAVSICHGDVIPLLSGLRRKSCRIAANGRRLPAGFARPPAWSSLSCGSATWSARPANFHLRHRKRSAPGYLSSSGMGRGEQWKNVVAGIEDRRIFPHALADPASDANRTSNKPMF